ncbi:uncharacterized protein [Apostichopus japonicus]|uniref:uncharacterized protein isoform X2 n=1 Tax=Stichopus japonicus TaxID=307972 RepID=UPI003AB1AAD1
MLNFHPITKVSQLLNHKESKIKINDTINRLIPVAQSVLRASEELATVASNSAANFDAEGASEKLIKAGRSILMAIQLLKAENGSKRSRDTLANSTNQLLNAVVQILRVLKSSKAQNVIQSAESVLDCLKNLCLVTTIEDLVPAFQKFTRALLLFAHLCEELKTGIDDAIQRERLSANLKSLKKLIPALKSVVQNQVKYPQNIHAKASCKLVERHFQMAIASTTKVIQGPTKPPTSPKIRKEEGQTSPSHFAADVAELVHLLSPKHRKSVLPSLKSVVSRVVRHSMTVGVMSRDDLKAEITEISQEVLGIQEQVMERQTAMEDNLDFSQLASDFNQSCEDLARKVLSLESFIRSAVIHLSVEALVQTTEPMSRIVKAATVHVKDRRILKDADCLSVLQPLDDDLHDHMDQLCQVASFVASGCSNEDKLDKLTKSIDAIEELDADILPSCLAVRRESGNKAAVAHLKLIYQDWCQEVENLVDGMLAVINPDRFLEISENSLESDLEDCRHAALIPDADFLAESVNKMLGRTKQVVRVGKDIQNKSEDPIYRNGIQVFLDQIQNAIPLVRNGGHYATNHVTNPRAQKQLRERGQHLIESVHLLKEGVHSKNQPGLMSPLRDNVRRTLTGDESFLTGSESSVAEKRRIRSLTSSKFLDNTSQHHSSLVRSPSPLKGGSSKDTASSDRTIRNNATAASSSDIHFPDSKLDLVYPARDIIRSVFEHDQDKVIELLAKLKKKSTSLIDIAEALCSIHTLEGISPTIAKNLMKATGNMSSSSLAAISGDDILQAECLLAADKWSSDYGALESSIRSTLHPLDTLLLSGTTTHRQLPDSETGSLSQFQEHVLEMVATLMATMDALECHTSHRRDIEQQTSEWSTLGSSLMKEESQLKLNPENQSLLDEVDHKRLWWTIKLTALSDAVVRYLRKRQEGWLDVMGEKGWMTPGEVRGSISKMKTDTDTYVQLSNLLSLCASNTHDEEKMLRAREELQKVCNDLTRYGRYGNSDSMTLTSATEFVTIVKWCVMMHQLSDWLDRLSADVGLRIDRLMSSAHAAFNSTGPSRQHFLVELQGQSDALSLVVTQVRQVTVSALMAVPSHTHKTSVLTSLDELSRVTPKLISLTRDLVDDKLSSFSELNHIKRSWLCHATGIISGLKVLPNIEENTSQDVERLLGGATSVAGVFNASMTNSVLGRPSGQSPFTPVSYREDPSRHYYSSHLSPHIMLSGDPGSLDVSATHTPVEHILSPQYTTTDCRHRYRPASGYTTGQAKTLYADSSHSWQGLEPRQVTTSKRDPQETRKSPKPYRSQPLGLHEPPIKSASTSSLPAAPIRPPLHRTDSMKCYSSIEATALMLQQEADKWEPNQNSYVQAIKQLSENMKILSRFGKEPHGHMSKTELISAARAIATEACSIHQFAEVIIRHAKDTQQAEDLETHSRQIPALATQLNIISTVKTATPECYNSDVVIVTNAERLMDTVMYTLNAAESLCVKGLRSIEDASTEEAAAATLAAQWKRKLQRHRQIEATSTNLDAFGLRRISKHTSMPSLTEMLVHKGSRS